jgi:hypothetical protein
LPSSPAAVMYPKVHSLACSAGALNSNKYLCESTGITQYMLYRHVLSLPGASPG